VYGRKSIIDSLTEIPVEVDLSKITESKTYEYDVKLPEGVTKISDSKIKIKADITKVEQEKTTPTTSTPPPPSEEPDTTPSDENTPTEKTEDIDS